MRSDRVAVGGDTGPPRQLSESALSISELSARPDASPPGPGRCLILLPTCLSILLKFIGTGTTVALILALSSAIYMLCT
jgi:hypothetical protein